MNSLREFGRRVAFLFRRNRFEHELLEEFRFHVETRAEELIRAGMPRDEAIEAARREFGPALRVREETRTAWQFRWLEDLLVDVRYAARADRGRSRRSTAACRRSPAPAVAIQPRHSRPVRRQPA